MKLLFLYSELAQYMLDCINELPFSWEVTIVHWPINPEAPYKFKVANHIKLISKSEDKKIQTYIENEDPDAIFVTGWLDQGYSKTLKKYTGKAKKVIMFDTAWNGSIKQKAGIFYLKQFVSKTFNFAFVSGNKQALYAKKLGIRSSNIYTGLYTANAHLFSEMFNQKVFKAKLSSSHNLPKNILYLGRYVKHKGIFELWEAFKEIINENQNLKHWELVCVGTGDQWENRVKHSNIKHLGFLQPNEMEPVLLDTSIYILPSHFEPWGVSVHEMAAAGFPLLLSEEVGSKEAFLEEGKNGFSFPAKNKQALKASLLKMMQLPESDLQQMGKHSNKLAQKITPQKWVETIQSILED